MRLFQKKFRVDYDYLISNLAKGDSNEIYQMLWQPKNMTINYLPITTELIRKLKTDNSSKDKLAIHKQIHKGHFELLIFEISGTIDKIQYSPLLIDKVTSKIVGIVLPFNELYGHFTKKENKQLLDLSIIWTKFIIKDKFEK